MATEKNNEKESVYITMLGDFTVKIGDKVVADQRNQAKKPWIILEYLIAFRKREIPMPELTELIWPGSRSKNPLGALKTLIFRSRQLLVPLEYPTHNLIIQKNNTYAWNVDQVETIVDIDLFENTANEILSDKSSLTEPDSILEACLSALSIYKGDFLKRSGFETWVVPISAYYHSLFQQVLYKALDILMQKEDYAKIIELCEHALTIDAYDEEVHYDLITALYRNGQQQKALDRYSKTTSMFYSEFSITPTERFQSLYKTIQDTRHGIITDLSLVQEKLAEESTYKGAYGCEYSVFKDIYQLECRSIERTGDSIFLCMISISDADGDLLKSSVLTKAMDELGNAIRDSLRRGDVYTRFSISQYLFLLPTASQENANMVIDRIIKFFKKEYTRKDLAIDTSVISLRQNIKL